MRELRAEYNKLLLCQQRRIDYPEWVFDLPRRVKTEPAITAGIELSEIPSDRANQSNMANIITEEITVQVIREMADETRTEHPIPSSSATQKSREIIDEISA